MSSRLLKSSILPLMLVFALPACKQERPVTTIESAPVAQALVKVNTGSIKLRTTFNPEEVVLVDGTQQKTMRYMTPQIRTAARALGFGGVGQYAVLRGTRATLRVSSRQPVFVFAVPSNAQAESYFTLANFATRDNGTREVIVGGGYMSYSTGINKDRVVPTSVEPLSDQTKAPKNFTLYAAMPNAPMNSGEYAMVFYNSQIRAVGFAPSADSYFDFGVDN